MLLMLSQGDGWRTGSFGCSLDGLISASSLAPPPSLSSRCGGNTGCKLELGVAVEADVIPCAFEIIDVFLGKDLGKDLCIPLGHESVWLFFFFLGDNDILDILVILVGEFLTDFLTDLRRDFLVGGLLGDVLSCDLELKELLRRDLILRCADFRL